MCCLINYDVNNYYIINIIVLHICHDLIISDSQLYENKTNY